MFLFLSTLKQAMDNRLYIIKKHGMKIGQQMGSSTYHAKDLFCSRMSIPSHERIFIKAFLSTLRKKK